MDNTLCTNTGHINIILHHPYDPNLVLLCFIIHKTGCLPSHSVQKMIFFIYIFFIVSKVKCSILFNKKYYFPILRHEVSQRGLVKDGYQTGRERDILGYFHCRASCGLVFSTKAIRNK